MSFVINGTSLPQCQTKSRYDLDICAICIIAGSSRGAILPVLAGSR
jgi:hypothetical protein